MVLSELCLVSTIIFIFKTISLNTEHILMVLSELCSVFTEIVLTLPSLAHLAPLKSLITLSINICKITFFPSTQFAYIYVHPSLSL